MLPLFSGKSFSLSRAAKGVLGETIARALYFFKGYKCVGRRLRTPFGEIDLLLRKGDFLVAAEVKTRRDKNRLAESLSLRQKERLTRAAAYILGKRRAAEKLSVRFDAVFIWPFGARIIQNAWDASDLPL